MNFRIIILFCICNFLTSCSAKDDKNDLDKIDFKKLLNLKNYKTVERKVNDSVFHISGFNGNTKINGNLNKNQNKKFGWWNLYDSKTKTSIKIEMLIEDGRNSKNQILIFSDGKLNPYVSKFYKIENNDNTINYTFNVPSDTFKRKKNFYSYLIFDKNFNELERNQVSIKQKPNINIYNYKIDLSKYLNKKPIIISGIFTESTYNFKKNAAENWDIMTFDSIR